MLLRVERAEVLEHSKRVREAWYELEGALGEHFGIPFSIDTIEGWASQFDLARSLAQTRGAESGQLLAQCNRFSTKAQNGSANGSVAIEPLEPAWKRVPPIPSSPAGRRARREGL